MVDFFSLGYSRVCVFCVCVAGGGGGGGGRPKHSLFINVFCIFFINY